MNSKKMYATLAMAMAMMAGADDVYAHRRHNQVSRKKPAPRPLPEVHRTKQIFSIHGVQIEAYSRKDAITRYRHMKSNNQI